MNEAVITSAELDSAVDADGSNTPFRVAAGLLVCALNDWPTMNLCEPADLIRELKAEAGPSLTRDALREYSERLPLDAGAWKLEALASVLLIFDCFAGPVDLGEIMARITSHYRR